MKKKNIIMVAALAALATLSGTTAITLQAKGGFGVFATVRLNEYGCESNCTAEYYPSDLITRVKADTTLVGTQNVRVIAKACNIASDTANTYFQDITYGAKAITVLDPAKHFDGNLVIRISGTVSGLSYTACDTVAFYGEIGMKDAKFGNRGTYTIVEIKNPTVYQVNNQKDLSLLVDPVYLGQ